MAVTVHGIDVQTGAPLRKFYFSMVAFIGLGTFLGTVPQGVLGEDLTTETVRPMLLLWLVTPVVLVAFTVYHEFVHAILSRWLLNGHNVCIRFSALGGVTAANIDEHSTLWRKLLTILAPAVSSVFLGIVFCAGAVLLAPGTPGVVDDLHQALATSFLLMAAVNLCNLVPFGKLDGGIALKEVLRSFTAVRRTRNTPVAI